jgi:hypothetical protein
MMVDLIPMTITEYAARVPIYEGDTTGTGRIIHDVKNNIIYFERADGYRIGISGDFVKGIFHPFGTKEDIIEQWGKLSDCIKKHWGDRHEAPKWQYNRVVEELDKFGKLLSEWR